MIAISLYEVQFILPLLLFVYSLKIKNKCILKKIKCICN